MSKQDAAVHVLAPRGIASAHNTSGAQHLTGTGTTEAASTVALTQGRFASLMVGDAAIRVTFHPTAAAVALVAVTSLVVGPYGRFDWLVDYNTQFVAVEAADGASDYEAWVWTSSANL